MAEKRNEAQTFFVTWSRQWETFHQVVSAVVSSYLCQNTTNEINIFSCKMIVSKSDPFYHFVFTVLKY